MESITFMTSLLTFFIKGEITPEQNFLKLSVPNTILGFIPLGAKKDTIPVTQISSVETNFKLLFKNFLIGVVIAILGFVCFSQSVLLGLVLLVVGAVNIINSFQTVLAIRLTSSTTKYIAFLIFEASKAGQAADLINRFIAMRQEDTNVRQHTEKQTAALVDAIASGKKE